MKHITKEFSVFRESEKIWKSCLGPSVLLMTFNFSKY